MDRKICLAESWRSGISLRVACRPEAARSNSPGPNRRIRPKLGENRADLLQQSWLFYLRSSVISKWAPWREKTYVFEPGSNGRGKTFCEPVASDRFDSASTQGGPLDRGGFQTFGPDAQPPSGT